MPAMYGLKDSGYRERAGYRNAALEVGQLNAMSPSIQMRGAGENLGATLRSNADRRHLEDATFTVREAQAEQALKNVQNQAGRMGAAALDQARRTGNWGEFEGALTNIAGQATQARQRIGAGAMSQFRAPTMGNFRRRMDFGRLMDAAGTEAAREVRGWAAMALGVEEDDRRFAFQRDQFNADEAYKQRMLDERDEDQEQRVLDREAASERQGALDQYRIERDGRRDALDERKFKMSAEDTLLKRGHSPAAVKRALDGDDSLLQEELESGDLKPLGRSKSGTSGTTKKGGALDKIMEDPGKHEAYIAAQMKKRGVDYGALQPEQQEALFSAVSVEYERSGKMDKALDAAYRFAAPDEYAQSAFKRFSLDDPDFMAPERTQSFLEGVDEIMGTTELDREDAEALVLTDLAKSMPAGPAFIKNNKDLTAAYKKAIAKVEAFRDAQKPKDQEKSTGEPEMGAYGLPADQGMPESSSAGALEGGGNARNTVAEANNARSTVAEGRRGGRGGIYMRGKEKPAYFDDSKPAGRISDGSEKRSGSISMPGRPVASLERATSTINGRPAPPQTSEDPRSKRFAEHIASRKMIAGAILEAFHQPLEPDAPETVPTPVPPAAPYSLASETVPAVTYPRYGY